jgi:hypothetical protein
MKRYPGKGKQMDEVFQYMWNNPPSCIKGISAKADPGLMKAHLSMCSTVFGVRCKCGNRTVSVRGKEVGPDYAGVGEPVEIRCPACNQTAVLFDAAIHGYEGALGLAGHLDHSGLPDKGFICIKCGGRTFDVCVTFEYSGDEAETVRESGESVRPEDLFGWIVGQSRCATCGTEQEMFAIECA